MQSTCPQDNRRATGFLAGNRCGRSFAKSSPFTQNWRVSSCLASKDPVVPRKPNPKQKEMRSQQACGVVIHSTVRRRCDKVAHVNPLPQMADAASRFMNRKTPDHFCGSLGYGEPA